MEKDLDPEVIKSTQISLGKYVKRPPLSEKLLKKPPFRFLHDVITTVLKTTGFFENLFDEEELVSDNVKDRDSKIIFLQKVIYVIGATTGKQLSVKPSKIVAGQEPEKTNELLQCLAQALDDKLSSDIAVKQYKESVNSNQISDTKTKDTGKVVKKGNDTKKLTSKSSEKLTSQKSDVTRSTTKQDKEKSNDVKSKKKDNSSSKTDIQSHQKKIQAAKAVVKKNVKEQKDPKTDNVQARSQISTSQHNVETQRSPIENEISLSIETKPNTLDLEVLKEKEDCSDDQPNDIQADPSFTQPTNEIKINSSYSIGVNDLDSSSSSNDLLETTHVNARENSLENYNTREILLPENQQNNHENETPQGNIETNIPNKLKPSSAINKKELDYKIVKTEREDPFNAVKVPFTNGNDTKIPHPPNTRPASVRPSSSRPGAPRTREKVDNVIKETDNLLMGKVNIIAENTHNEEEEDSSPIIMDHAEPMAAAQDQQELHLSSSEHGHLVQQILDSQKELTQISGKTEIEWQFGAQKAREAMNQDVEQLRFNIQALSRVANPLGKLLDHIQEDVEVMRQELQQWSNIYDDVNKEMLKEKTLNEDSLMPFYSKLKQLEVDIDEKHDKINDLKIMIHKNSVRIEKLLSSGNVQ